ncbi:carbohydrate ABC transporter permease [Brachybacterium hainanense]|uniref:Carbohydrate ABC transporter permease n=1 Tax=Brachybacterium hainanense TaxID=1541174 RepID=A0ABV6R5T6_9MICO
MTLAAPAPAADRRADTVCPDPDGGSVHRRRRPRSASSFLRAAVILVFTLWCALPLVWMVLSAFKTNVDINNVSRLLVFTPTLKNFETILASSNLVEAAWNSLIVAVGSTALAVLLGLPAAYVIARYSMNRTAFVLLVIRMLPGIIYLIPWYIIFTRIGLVGSYASLILSHLVIVMPMTIWIMMGFFATVPRELEEAASMDGLTRAQAFVRIVLPVVRSGIATAALLSFIFSWNQLLFSMVLGSSRLKTLPVALFDFIGYASIDWGGLMAAAVLMSLPIFVFSIVAQRHIVAGLSAGATKG